jgi:hypothetical protein
MKPTHRQLLWIGLGIALLVVLIPDSSPSHEARPRLMTLPEKGLSFTSQDLALNPTEAQVYRKADSVKRLYQTRRARFILTAVDGTHNRHAVHDPLYCFRGDGWDVVQRDTLQVPGGRATRLILARSGHRTEAVFWFTNGRERCDSAWRAWWMGLCRRVMPNSGSHEPALVLLQGIQGESPAWASVFAQCPFLFEL